MLSSSVNRTPHPRPENADIPIGDFSPLRLSPGSAGIPISGFPPLRQYHLAFRPKPAEASAKAGPPPLSSFCFLASHFSIPQPLCFDTLADSPTQRQPLNPFLINHFRTLFIATAGVPPPQKNPKREPASNPIGNGGLHAIEEKQPPDHHERDGRAGSQQQQAGSLPPPGDRPPETVNHPSHRVQPVQPPPARRNDSGGIDDGTGEQPELHEERSHIPHIPVQSIQRRQPQSHAQRGKEGERQQRRQPQRRQRRPDPVSHCK